VSDEGEADHPRPRAMFRKALINGASHAFSSFRLAGSIIDLQKGWLVMGRAHRALV
jgi:hypothetical protein